MSEHSATYASNSLGTGATLLVVGAGAVLVFVVLKTIYNAVTNTSAADEREPEPAMPRPITHSELSAATGDPGQELYIAVKDPFGPKVTVFDVKSGIDFYGPGGPYSVFAGKNATFGLAKSSTDPSQVAGDLSTLTASEKDTHMGWYNKYAEKYPIVGFLVPDDYEASAEQATEEASDTKKDA